MKNLVLILVMAVFGVSAFAQPANDDPCHPVSINPTNCAVVTNQTNIGTLNASLFTVTCDGIDGSNSNTIWYQFTTPDNLYGIEVNFSNTTFPPGTNVSVLAVQNFDCNAFTAFSVTGDMEYCGSPSGPIELIGNFLPGETYTIQISTLTINAGNFNICFQELLPPDGCSANNNCDLGSSFPPEDIGVLGLDNEQTCVDGCNTGASIGNAGTGCFDFTNEPTVWYTFTTSAEDAIVNIHFESNDIISPHIAVFNETDCVTSSASDQCFEGTTGTGTEDFFFSVIVSHTYMIAVSGTNQEHGNFSICLEGLNDATVCNSTGELVLTNRSGGDPDNPDRLDGPFCPGETLSFTYVISGYDQINCNWLHGVVPAFGDGWDPASFNANGEPAVSTIPGPRLNTGGAWGWWEQGVVQYNVTNIILGYSPNEDVYTGGWYFMAPSQPYPNPTNPNQSYGDGNSCADHVNAVWFFSFDLIVGEDVCSDGTNLDVSMIAFGDGETGAWHSLACTFEALYSFTANANCLTATIDYIPDDYLCPDETIDIALSTDNDPDAVFSWEITDIGPHITGAEAGTGDAIVASLSSTGLYSETVTYTVSAVSSVACSIEPISFTVEVYPRPSTEFEVETPICIDNSATVQYLGTLVGDNYIEWYLGGGTPVPANPEINPTEPFEVSWTTPGPHEIYLSVIGDYCNDESDFVEINVLPNDVVVDITEDDFTICNDASATPVQLHVSVSNGDATGSGSWSGPGVSATGVFTPADANIGSNVIVYTYVEHGCTNADQITISIVDPPTVSFTVTSPICLDNFSSVAFTGSASATASFDWNFDGGTIASGTGTTADPYHITWASPGIKNISLTVSEGACSNVATETVVVDPTLGIEIAPIPNNPICLTNSTGPIQLTLNYSDGANGSGTATWSGSGVSSSGLFTPTGAGSFSIQCTYSQGSCSATDDYTIDVIQTPDAEFTVTTPICQDSYSTISIANTPSGAATLTWDFDGGVIEAGAGTTANPYHITWATAGVKTITLTVTDGGCSETYTETVVVDPILGIAINDVSPNPMCFTEDMAPIQLSYSYNLGADGSGTAVWNGAGVSSSGLFTPSGAGDFTVECTYTQGECSVTDNYLIVINPTPTAEFSVSDDLICADEEITVTFQGDAVIGSSVFNWSWDGGTASGTGQGPYSVSWVTPGEKTITLWISQYGCESEVFSQTVTIEAPLVAPIINCEDQTPTSVTFSWDAIDGATSYIVTEGASSTPQSATTYTVTGLAANDEVTITVEFVGNGVCDNITTSGTCTAIDCPDFGITFDNAPETICLDGTQTTTDLEATITNTTVNGDRTWSGAGITDAATGLFDPDVAGPGIHSISLTYEEGPCSRTESFTVTVLEKPEALFEIETPVCELSTATIYYSGNSSSSFEYTWDFDGGVIQSGSGTFVDPYEVFWSAFGLHNVTLDIDNNGCSSQLIQEITIEPPLALTGTCSATTSSVTYTWDNIGPVSISVNSGQIGSQSGNTYTVTGMTSGEASSITVTADDGNSCGNPFVNLDCVAADCPPIDVIIDEPVPEFCLDGSEVPYQITVTVTGDDDDTGSGVFDPITGFDIDTYMFDPATAGAGTHILHYTYTDEGCIFTDDLTIIVNEPPTSDFSFTTPVCLTDYSEVLHIGAQDPDYIYTWDFAGGVGVPGTGPGTHQVAWTTPGAKTVALTVSKNGCASTTSHEIEVIEPEVLTVTCGVTTTSSVTFEWNAITGATGYIVIVNGETFPTQTQTNFTQGGLAPGDIVTIHVEAIVSGPCAPPSADGSCTAQDCPTVTVTIDEPVPEFCLDSAPYTLTTTVIGDDMNEGSGVFLNYTGLDPNTGVFTPSVAGVGTHLLTYQYELAGCTYTDNVTVIVNSDPPSDFTYTDVICLDGTSAIEFAEAQNPDYIYTWSFDGGVATPGTGPGVHQVSWTTPGIKTVSLTVNYHGCESTTTHEVEVIPPQVLSISCSANTTSVTFNWNEITGATGYLVSIDNGTQEEQNTTSYTQGGLIPGDNVLINVTAILDSPCDAPYVEGDCTAKDCPPVIVTIDEPIPEFCLNDDVSTYALRVTITDDTSSTSTGIWQPYTGLDINTGVFDPAVAGAGSHTLTYVHTADGCDFTDDVTVIVHAPPSNDFTVVSPVCIDNPTTLTYSGTVTAGMSFAWDVGTGTPAPDVTGGPHNVQWSDAGMQNVSLVVTENNCAAAPFNATVEVTAPMEDVVVNCNEQGLDYVEFIWNAVPGADGYNVTILTPVGGTGVSTGANTYRIDGLVEGQIAEIQVEAYGSNVCGSSFGTGQCEARQCPPLNITVNDVSDMCYSAGLQPVNLIANFNGHAPTGTGTWSENGVAINLGIFDPVIVGVGTHVIDFRYVEDGCAYNASTTINIYETPIADAGDDQEISCDNSEIILGSDNSSSGAGITYTWTATSGIFPGDTAVLHPVVDVTGDYLFTVSNEHGCSSQDRVIVDGGQDTPIPEITTNDISCFGSSDGYINIDSVSGGVGPYLYAHNDGDFQTSSLFSSLSAGTHSIQVMDVNGCLSGVINLTVIEPEEVDVQLIAQFEDDNIINFGDSLLLIAETVPPPEELDTVIWTPNANIVCDTFMDTTCANVWAFPIEHTVFTVTVGKNGCYDSDNLEIFVKKERPVYVPNTISPTSTNANNNRITVFANQKQVKIINDFMIFNRWGENVYEIHNFYPNDARFGWDGTYRGQLLNPAVFVYYVEVTFVDGTVEVYHGDITLIR